MLLAYAYAVQPDKDKNEFHSGWTKGRDEDDARETLRLRFSGVPDEQIKVFSYGETWESFILSESGPNGWD